MAIKRKAYKPKKCKACGKQFTPRQLGQKVCNIECSLAYARNARSKATERSQKQILAARKTALKTKSDWTKEAQAAFNKYIRLRDELAGHPCISCGTLNPQHGGRGGLWDAGHYLSRGSSPEKRFLEDNCHRQCKKCNTHGFSSAQYRKNLLARIGPERLAAVEGPVPIPQYRRDDLIAIRDRYRAKYRALKKGTE